MVDFRMRQGVQMYDVIKQDKYETRRIEGMQKREKEARDQIENMKMPALKKRLEENFRAELEEQGWTVNAEGHRVMKVDFDHYRGLVGLSDCKCIAPNTPSITLWPAIAFETAAYLFLRHD